MLQPYHCAAITAALARRQPGDEEVALLSIEDRQGALGVSCRVHRTLLGHVDVREAAVQHYYMPSVEVDTGYTCKRVTAGVTR